MQGLHYGTVKMAAMNSLEFPRIKMFWSSAWN